MPLDEQYFLKLLRQQIIFEYEEDADNEARNSTNEVHNAQESDANNQTIKSAVTILCARTTEAQWKAIEPGFEDTCKIQVNSTRAQRDEIDISRYQLDIDVKTSREEQNSLKIPIFRRYIPSRVVMSAQRLINNSSLISPDEALRRASALHGMSIRRINTNRVSRKEGRQSSRKKRGENMVAGIISSNSRRRRKYAKEDNMVPG